jgi:RecG-like helicase
MRNATAVSTTIGAATAGPRVRVSGTVGAVVIAPIGAAQTLEAELEDGTGRVSLLWLGRRQVLGVRPGRRLQACGRITRRDGRNVIFNPDYTLMP